MDGQGEEMPEAEADASPFFLPSQTTEAALLFQDEVPGCHDGMMPILVSCTEIESSQGSGKQCDSFAGKG